MRFALWLALLLASIVISSGSIAAQSFDRSHRDWTALLSEHVRWNAAGTTTGVDYAGLARDRVRLDAYLTVLAGVTEAEFRRWPKHDRDAFLINAYNAATVQLILSEYPKLTSIKELGSLLRSPWKKSFVDLLGKRRSLDDIEHGLLRGAADYRDPRIHFAANCASIGCPALRPEAYVGSRLDTQLADQTRRFLADRSRNRLRDGAPLVAELSPIFDWYGDDFRHGGGLDAFLADHAEALSATPVQAKALRAGRYTLKPLDYDWRLNDIGRPRAR